MATEEKRLDAPNIEKSELGAANQASAARKRTLSSQDYEQLVKFMHDPQPLSDEVKAAISAHKRIRIRRKP